MLLRELRAPFASFAVKFCSVILTAKDAKIQRKGRQVIFETVSKRKT